MNVFSFFFVAVVVIVVIVPVLFFTGNAEAQFLPIRIKPVSLVTDETLSSNPNVILNPRRIINIKFKNLEDFEVFCSEIVLDVTYHKGDPQTTPEAGRAPLFFKNVLIGSGAFSALQDASAEIRDFVGGMVPQYQIGTILLDKDSTRCQKAPGLVRTIPFLPLSNFPMDSSPQIIVLNSLDWDKNTSQKPAFLDSGEFDKGYFRGMKRDDVLFVSPSSMELAMDPNAPGKRDFKLFYSKSGMKVSFKMKPTFPKEAFEKFLQYYKGTLPPEIAEKLTVRMIPILEKDMEISSALQSSLPQMEFKATKKTLTSFEDKISVEIKYDKKLADLIILMLSSGGGIGVNIQHPLLMAEFPSYKTTFTLDKKCISDYFLSLGMGIPKVSLDNSSYFLKLKEKNCVTIHGTQDVLKHSTTVNEIWKMIGLKITNNPFNFPQDPGGKTVLAIGDGEISLEMAKKMGISTFFSLDEASGAYPLKDNSLFERPDYGPNPETITVYSFPFKKFTATKGLLVQNICRDPSFSESLFYEGERGEWLKGCPDGLIP